MSPSAAQFTEEESVVEFDQNVFSVLTVRTKLSTRINAFNKPS